MLSSDCAVLLPGVPALPAGATPVLSSSNITTAAATPVDYHFVWLNACQSAWGPVASYTALFNPTGTDRNFIVVGWNRDVNVYIALQAAVIFFHSCISGGKTIDQGLAVANENSHTLQRTNPVLMEISAGCDQMMTLLVVNQGSCRTNVPL